MNAPMATDVVLSPKAPPRLPQVVVDRLAGESVSFGALYDEGATLYDALTANDVSEVDRIVDYARDVRTPVLDLACGSGRLSLPLLERGHRVVGIDTSAKLLELFRHRVADRGYDDRVELINTDMAGFQLDTRFDLIFCGITSISLLSAEARLSLFLTVRQHLTLGGRFVFSTMFQTEDDEEVRLFSAIARTRSGRGRTTFIDVMRPDRTGREIYIDYEPIRGVPRERTLYYSHTEFLLPAHAIAEAESCGLEAKISDDASAAGRHVAEIVCSLDGKEER